MNDRDYNLKRMQTCLNTEDGLYLMEELEETWDKFSLQGQTPEDTAYNVGLRDGFKFLRELQKGALIGKPN